VLGDARFGEDNPPRNLVGGEMWIGRTEVTVAAYGECVAAGRCEPAGKGPDCNTGLAGRANHPVNCVRAVDAQAYAVWRGEAGGVRYRLPTCDEWERAARLAGRFPWGEDEPGARCNSCDRRCAFTNFRNEAVDDGARTTAPVASLPECRSPQGVFDQVGNVAEWCVDAPRTYQVRGGSWGQVGVFLEPAFAVRRGGDDRDPTVGFRVIVAAPASP
jgi:formylglycine-generating enzyme required for sulfatase activity